MGNNGMTWKEFHQEWDDFKNEVYGQNQAVVAFIAKTSTLLEEHAKKLNKQEERQEKFNTRLVIVMVATGLSLAAIAAHTGWTWLLSLPVAP